MNDWVWADVQAELHMQRLETINIANRILGEPELNPWELINVREQVDSINDAVRNLIAKGKTITL
jgi:hypothetical protein